MVHLLTITMNPTIDVSTSVDLVVPTKKLRCTVAKRDPGGGGINVARVASRLGAEATALYTVGGSVGQLLKRLVDAEKIESITIPVQEEARENLTALETSTGNQFRFVLSGPRLSEAEWRACLDAFSSLDARPQFIVLSGSLPPGVPEDFYVRVAEIARGWGVPLALDSSGAPLKAAVAHGVDLMKPNLHELQQLLDSTLSDEAAWIEACRCLVAAGKARIVVLTLGRRGALCVTREGAWRADALPINPISTVGAGDSFLGAMVWALASGRSVEDGFRYGMAAGSAALLAPGTELCRAADVHALVDQVVLRSVMQAGLLGAERASSTLPPRGA